MIAFTVLIGRFFATPGSWFGVAVVMVASLAVLGFLNKKRVLAILTDGERNKMSLARFQMVL